jgi:hypothetical protein
MSSNASSLFPGGIKRLLTDTLPWDVDDKARNTRTSIYANELIDDIVQALFLKCQSKSEWESIGALACVNTHYNQSATTYWTKFDLKLFCPKLTNLHASTQEIIVEGEPCVSKLAILKGYRDLVPQIEKNEGLTLLSMEKGLTLNQLVEIGANEMTVDVGWDQILQEVGDVPVAQTYVVLISNNVFKQSRKRNYALQAKCLAKHGCEMPTVQEYVALCVFTYKSFKKSLYGDSPMTFGRSSTYVGGCPLIIGGSSREHLSVYDSHYSPLSLGAGGRRKL